MTKEEQLKQEAEEYAQGMAKYYESAHGSIPSQFEKYLRNAYISSAEPREKRISELETEVNRLKLNEQLAVNNGKNLLKENAELKEKKIKGCYFGKDELGNDFFAKCDCVDCQKRTIALLDLRKEYLNKINKEKTINDQLTKAKELLKQWLQTSKASGCNNINIVTDTEQFLKE